MDDSGRQGSPQAIGGLHSASGVAAVPNDVRPGDLAIIPGIQAHSLRRETHPSLQLLRWGWPWSQSIDQPQNFLEQFLRHRDLGHLEDDVASMARRWDRCFTTA